MFISDIINDIRVCEKEEIYSTMIATLSDIFATDELLNELVTKDGEKDG